MSTEKASYDLRPRNKKSGRVRKRRKKGNAC